MLAQGKDRVWYARFTQAARLTPSGFRLATWLRASTDNGEGRTESSARYWLVRVDSLRNAHVLFPIAYRLPSCVNRVLLVLASLRPLPRYDTYDEVMKVLPKLPRPVLISFLRPVRVGKFMDGNHGAVVRRSSTPPEVTREWISPLMFQGFARNQKFNMYCVFHACCSTVPAVPL